MERLLGHDRQHVSDHDSQPILDVIKKSRKTKRKIDVGSTDRSLPDGRC